MSLDQNLFTLSLAQSTEEPTALDLTDPSTNTIHYRKRRHSDQEKGDIAYAWGMYDPLSESLLATVTAQNAVAKNKTIELHNPSAKVELAFTGTLTFKWCFDWEGHTFEWRREACYILRKPDPPVQVAVTREPAGKIKTSLVQLLDYNLNRFDINDRKGLEIVMLAALLTFQDQSEEIHNGNNSGVTSPAGRAQSMNEGPPLPGKSGAELVEGVQVKAGAQPNEVHVAEVGTVEDYAQHCVKMLKDDSILYVIIKAQGAEQVPKVVSVAEAAKRLHYRSGGYDQELHQYVTWQDVKPKGPKIIKLDEPDGKEHYRPPQTIVVHLSKIAMPELQPKARPKPTPAPTKANESRPSTWFGFGAGPSDAKLPKPAPEPPAPSPNLRLPNTTHGRTSSNQSSPSQAGPSRPPQPALNSTPPQPPRGKEKDKKDKKDRLKKGPQTQQPPPQQAPRPNSAPNGRVNIPPHPNPYGLPQQSRPSPQMPGAMPPSNRPTPHPSPPQQNFYPGPYPPQPPSNGAPKPSAGFSAPPGPPPQQPAAGTGITGMITTQIANVGYSLLDRLTSNTPATRPK